MDKKRIAFDIPWPGHSLQSFQIRKVLRKWLPGRGNVLFTLLLVAGLFWVQNSSAFSLQQPSTSAASGTIAYQGRLADSNGQPIVAASHPMVFRLYASDSADAVPLWTENWTGSNAVEVSDGLFNVMLGSLDPIPQSIITGNDTLFLGISVGSDDEMTPRIQLGSVPYAAQALTVPDGSITTAKLASGSVTQDKLDPTLDLVPSGAIVMWSGALSDIPDGWVLCDGTNGTPDLRDRFVLGTDTGEQPGATGGSHTVALTIQNMPAHTHTFTTDTGGSHSHGTHIKNEDEYSKGGNGGVDDTSDNGIRTSNDGAHSHSGTTNSTGNGAAFDNRPKYLKLAFIMKQ